MALQHPNFKAPKDVPSRARRQVRLGILASGRGTNVEAIAAAVDNGQLDADVACVVCNCPEAGALEVAERHDVASVVIDHREFSSRPAFDACVADALEAHRVQWVIMAGWMRVMSAEFVAKFAPRILNIHPSLLPSFPGAHAVEDALAAGVKITGVTIHRVTAKVDSGPIVAQAAVAVDDHDTPDSLHRRIQAQEHAIYAPAIGLAIAQSEQT